MPQEQKEASVQARLRLPRPGPHGRIVGYGNRPSDLEEVVEELPRAPPLPRCLRGGGAVGLQEPSP